MTIYVKDINVGMTVTYNGMTDVIISVRCDSGIASVETSRSRFWCRPLSTVTVAP